MTRATNQWVSDVGGNANKESGGQPSGGQARPHPWRRSHDRRPTPRQNKPDKACQDGDTPDQAGSTLQETSPFNTTSYPPYATAAAANFLWGSHREPSVPMLTPGPVEE